jgi:hypothetical protein
LRVIHSLDYEEGLDAEPCDVPAGLFAQLMF